MDVKPIRVLLSADGRPAAAGHFCTVRLHPANSSGEFLLEIVPTRRVLKKIQRPCGRYLIDIPPAVRQNTPQ